MGQINWAVWSKEIGLWLSSKEKKERKEVKPGQIQWAIWVTCTVILIFTRSYVISIVFFIRLKGYKYLWVTRKTYVNNRYCVIREFVSQLLLLQVQIHKDCKIKILYEFVKSGIYKFVQMNSMTKSRSDNLDSCVEFILC